MSEQKNRKVTKTITIDPGIYEQLKTVAEKDRRTMSAMLELVIEEWLKIKMDGAEIASGRPSRRRTWK